jgi:hypothetical protein
MSEEACHRPAFGERQGWNSGLKWPRKQFDDFCSQPKISNNGSLVRREDGADACRTGAGDRRRHPGRHGYRSPVTFEEEHARQMVKSASLNLSTRGGALQILVTGSTPFDKCEGRAAAGNHQPRPGSAKRARRGAQPQVGRRRRSVRGLTWASNP